ncbi:MAG: lipocalin-like domain-containing protein [Bacteroidales bacterium]|nr:lipocalin-like domain-containing protein [Bacteroidales bacterium]
MEKLKIFILLIIVLCSCTDGDLPDVNGMWQLKTVENEAGEVQVVDTIYYSFQRQAIFSYTLLNEVSGKPASTIVLYGYVSFPDGNNLTLVMDKQYDTYNFDVFPRLERNMNYNILHLDSKKMVLFYNGETYNFIKF